MAHCAAQILVIARVRYSSEPEAISFQLFLQVIELLDPGLATFFNDE